MTRSALGSRLVALVDWLSPRPRPVGFVVDTIRDDPAPVALLVGLHGYGADERQLGSLVDVEVSAPIRYLAPRAPKPIAGGGYGWFDVALEGGTAAIDVRQVEQAVQDVMAWIEAHADGLPVVLLGYSQGATLALEIALRHGDRFAGIAAMAGRILTGAAGPVVGQVPFFFGHGTLDAFVDSATFARDVHTLRSRGFAVDAHSYRIPHVVSAAERRDLSAWLTPCLASARPESGGMSCPP